MLNTSKEFAQAIKDKKTAKAKINVILADGTELEIDTAHIAENSFQVEDGTSGSNDFQIGAAIINQFTVPLSNFDDSLSRYDFTDAVLYPYVGYELSAGTEWIIKGKYTVDTAIAQGNAIQITALDNMSKFDQSYSDVSTVYPADLARIVRDICTHCGVPLGTTTFDNASYVIQTRPADDALNCREMLSYVAQIAGCYARCNVDGALELRWYNTAVFEREDHLDGGRFDRQDPAKYMTGDDVDGGNFTDYSSGDTYDGGTFDNMSNYWHIYSLSSLTVSTDDVVITGIRVTAADGDDVDGETVLFGSEGYVLEIADNPLILPGQAQAVADYLGLKLVGMRFRPLSCNALGNPAIEAGDCAYVSDRKGNSYACYITNLTYTIGQYESFSCDAKTPSANSAKRYSEATKTVVAARKEIKKQISAYDQAVEQMGQLISQGTGMYMTKVEQDDGSVIYYMHDKPTIEESSYTCYRTSEGIIASLDGGVTWAVDKNGNALFNTIAARGITADWITAGTLQGVKIITDDPTTEFSTVIHDGGISVNGTAGKCNLLICSATTTSTQPYNYNFAIMHIKGTGLNFGYDADPERPWMLANAYVIDGDPSAAIRHKFYGVEQHNGNMGNIQTGSVTASGNISTSGNVNAKQYKWDGVNGVSGYFTTTDGKNVYVNGGIVTNIL